MKTDSLERKKRFKSYIAKTKALKSANISKEPQSSESVNNGSTGDTKELSSSGELDVTPPSKRAREETLETLQTSDIQQTATASQELPVSTACASSSPSPLPPAKSFGVNEHLLSGEPFSSMKDSISETTLHAIDVMGLKYMTKIQSAAIPLLLQGRDLVASAKTGSGKTLAFLVPCIELLAKLRPSARNGTIAVVMSPTRELALQTYCVLRELMNPPVDSDVDAGSHSPSVRAHPFTYGLVMGGTSRFDEAKKLAKGVNLLVATPGRLLDHLQNTPDFLYKNVQCLIIDEADRILDIGFEEEMKQIINLLPKKRQTMLFSATITPKTEDLISLALKKSPAHVGIDDTLPTATVEGLEQGYVLCESDKRFVLLFTFLRKNRAKKIMVFFSACLTVKYFSELLNYIDVPVMSIHGKQKQAKRTATFLQFCESPAAILLCTDVAARGLDIPRVDWIVQFDPPDDPKDYIHRVGRTARGENAVGHALLFLRPQERAFLELLRDARVPLQEYEFRWSKVADIQTQLEKLVASNFLLHQSAVEGFKAYVRAYASHSLRQVFDVNSLDLQAVGRAFGFTSPPHVDIGLSYSKKTDRRSRRDRFQAAFQNDRQHKRAKIFKAIGTVGTSSLKQSRPFAKGERQFTR